MLGDGDKGGFGFVEDFDDVREIHEGASKAVYFVDDNYVNLVVLNIL